MIRDHRQHRHRAQTLDVCPVADAARVSRGLRPDPLCDGRHPGSFCPAVVPIVRIVQVNGIQLAVAECGPADGPVVVLLHGFPELAFSWRHWERTAHVAERRITQHLLRWLESVH